MNKHEIRDECRANFNKYTRKAYSSFPEIENPNILDLGCGTGVPGLDLASLTGGTVTAVDTEADCLEWFRNKISSSKYQDRITIIQDSVLNVNFPENSFDIILAEGLLNVIGFEKGMKLFPKYLKTNGYFMIHDDALNREEKLQIIEQFHFELVTSFFLDENVWWTEFYSCLEKQIPEFEKKNTGNKEAGSLFNTEKSEIKMYHTDPTLFRSVYYVLRKIR